MIKNKNLSTCYVKFFQTPNSILFKNLEKFENIYKISYISPYKFINSWSTYNLQYPVFKRILESNIIEDDDYILCVFYNNDIQLGASETGKENEISIDNLKRCLGEELGLRLINGKLNNINFRHYSKYVDLWMIDINNLKKLRRSKSKNEKEDNKNQKSYCIVYGKLEGILNYLTDDIKFDHNEDNIQGVVAFNFSDLKNIFRLLIK